MNPEWLDQVSDEPLKDEVPESVDLDPVIGHIKKGDIYECIDIPEEDTLPNNVGEGNTAVEVLAAAGSPLSFLIRFGIWNGEKFTAYFYDKNGKELRKIYTFREIKDVINLQNRLHLESDL